MRSSILWVTIPAAHRRPTTVQHVNADKFPLAACDGVRAVLTGAPDEIEYVAGVTALLSVPARRRVINIAGKLSFEEFVASMDLYDFFVTNDSGPVHIAYAQGVDTISLWGVGRPSFYGPLIGNHSIFYQYLPCSPCLYMFTTETGQWCNHRGDCMLATEVDEVWNTVKSYLDHPTETRAAFRVRQGWSIPRQAAPTAPRAEAPPRLTTATKCSCDALRPGSRGCGSR